MDDYNIVFKMFYFFFSSRRTSNLEVKFNAKENILEKILNEKDVIINDLQVQINSIDLCDNKREKYNPNL